MAARNIEITEQVPASRKLGEKEARELIKGARAILVSKGRKQESWKGGRATRDVVAAFLGSTGNLRAPTVKSGSTVLVGWNEDVWKKVF